MDLGEDAQRSSMLVSCTLPNNGNDNRAAAEEIDDEEHLFPCDVNSIALLLLLQKYLSHDSEHLQRGREK